jgi:hypothetical protein
MKRRGTKPARGEREPNARDAARWVAPADRRTGEASRCPARRSRGSLLRPFPHVARDHHKVERLGEAALIARIHLTAPTTDDFAPRCTDQTERWEPWRRGT